MQPHQHREPAPAAADALEAVPARLALIHRERRGELRAVEWRRGVRGARRRGWRLRDVAWDEARVGVDQ